MSGLAEIVRLRTVDCRQAGEFLPMLAAGEHGSAGLSTYGRPRLADGRPSEGRSTEGRATEGRATEGPATEGRATEGRATEGPATEGRASEGRASEGRSAEAVPEQVADHVAQCLRCQAEMAAYRRILRHLRALRHDDVRSPPGALAAVLAALEVAALEDHAGGANRALRVAAVGGITVATAAATTAGVLVWMSRRRLGLAETG